MSKFYEEVLLREEYCSIFKLQKEKEFKKYCNIKYTDRKTGLEESVLKEPANKCYPETYIAEYHMPVYDKNFRLRKDWIGIIKINLTEKILTRNSNDNVQIALECNFLPINNHIYQNTTIDFGNLWQVSKEYGVWFFILGLGGLINQDEFFCADSPSCDYIAFEHWNKRGKKPITNINWEYIIQIIKDHE